MDPFEFLENRLPAGKPDNGVSTHLGKQHPRPATTGIQLFGNGCYRNIDQVASNTCGLAFRQQFSRTLRPVIHTPRRCRSLLQQGDERHRRIAFDCHRLFRLFRQTEFCSDRRFEFLYDMNALWNSNFGCNLRILLLNNGGGEIFQALPGLKMEDKTRRFVTATHKTSAKGWAKERGFSYLPVHNDEELTSAMAVFTQSVPTTNQC